MIDIQVTLETHRLLMLFFIIGPGALSEPLASATDLPRNTPVYTAIVNVTYRDPLTGEQKYEYNDGWFSSENRIGPSWGWLQLVRSADNRTDGCDPIVNRVEGWWVALVERGRCRFHQKIENAAVFNNASAVIVYNNEHDAQVLNMQHNVEDVVAIFLRRNDGLRLVKLTENNTKVFVTITPGSTYFPSTDAPSRTSIIFLFISFIVLAVVSLLWLIFYYVQRFRLHSSFGAERARKNKIVKQLNQAAKLVVSKMEQKILKPEDPELSSAELQICAVCVEEYKVNDKIRILPCRHSFHKKCVDQWLHEKRRCPICQLDILKTAGIQIPEEYQNLNNEGPLHGLQAANNNNNNDDDALSSNDRSSQIDDDYEPDTVLVSVVPGCSAHLYLTSVTYVNENAQSAAAAAATVAGGRDVGEDVVSDTTYHSNESLLVLEALEGVPPLGSKVKGEGEVSEGGQREFESVPSVVTLSKPPPSSLSSSSDSLTYDVEQGGGDSVEKSLEDDVVVIDNRVNDNSASMTSVNSRLTAVASRARDEDDDDGGGGDGDDDTSSGFSPSRYYDCHVETNKQQMN